MSNLTKRILSAIVLIPFIIYLVFFSSSLVLHISLCGISFLSCFEFLGICLSGKHRAQRVSISFLSSFLTYIIPYSFSKPILILAFLPLSIILLSTSFMFSREDLRDSLNGLSFSFFGLFYCGVLSSFIYLISYFDAADGRHFIFLLLLGTFIGDTGAYAFGRLFGKAKLYPKLSPGKTRVGSLGGLLMTSFSVMILKFFLIESLTFFEVFFLSSFLSVTCQIGDLAESFLKRGFGVKDSGTLIPGHGGILDRIDALLFGAPVVFLFSFLR